MKSYKTPGNIARRDIPADFVEALRSGSREALDLMVPLVYGELRQIAHRHLAGAGKGATLNTTALVNEAYLKLVDQSRAEWTDRVHFLALAAIAMRHILVDRAKAMRTVKRGGEVHRITLNEESVAAADAPDALLDISDAIDRLSAIDGRLAKIVEYRFFGGLSNAEIGAALDITERTVERDWIKARMLLREMLHP
jgi:RNA polymerase sigma factor (TIGR02999 family)